MKMSVKMPYEVKLLIEDEKDRTKLLRFLGSFSGSMEAAEAGTPGDAMAPYREWLTNEKLFPLLKAMGQFTMGDVINTLKMSPGKKATKKVSVRLTHLKHDGVIEKTSAPKRYVRGFTKPMIVYAWKG